MSDKPIVPVFEPNRGFRTWLRDEIYDGTGNGRYVPNPNDLVFSWVGGVYRVADVDYSTGISTLVRWSIPQDNSGLTEEDVLLGAGPGMVSESFRAYIDTSVMPHTLSVDVRLRAYSSRLSYVKIFKGTDIGVDGKVISRYYDQNGTFVGEAIPMELAVTPDQNNKAVKVPVTGYTIESLEDGELLTMVAYDDSGGAVSICKLLAMNTAFIRSTDTSRRYVTGIHLESTFLSDSEPNVLRYPVNMPIQAMPLMGVVTYSDGGTRRLPIDGNKFALHGLDNFVATIVGQRIPLVLVYTLSADEVSYNAESGQNKHIAETYWAETVEVENAYSVKLFGYPSWVNSLNGYRMEYFLYNLDRDESYDVTHLVELARNSAPFNPLLFGTTQNITVALDLDRVSGKFSKYRHVQTLGVTLMAPGNEDTLNWKIQYNPNLDPIYGQLGMRAEVRFINAEHWAVKVDCGAGSAEDWLDRVFYPTAPLYNPGRELEAPKPNMFRLVFRDRMVELPLEDWDKEIDLQTNNVRAGENIYIEFFRRTAATDLELSIAGLTIHQTNPV